MRSADDPHAVNFLIDEAGPDARAGHVRADPPSILWNGGTAATALIAGPFFVTPSAIALFFVTTGAALLLGHSVGYHRMMIHGSFSAPRWLERTLVWFGAFVGMAGPYGIIRAHDTRDWAQRQTDCHPFLAHKTRIARDAWWQIYCRLDLDHPPRFDFGHLDRDPFYRWLENTWRWQQLPVALLFFALGGWPWVVWGWPRALPWPTTAIGSSAILRTIAGRSAGPSMPMACKPLTSLGRRFRQWARPGTIIITPIPARRASACIRGRAIGVMPSSASASGSG